jgi:hypothetical protein
MPTYIKPDDEATDIWPRWCFQFSEPTVCRTAMWCCRDQASAIQDFWIATAKLPTRDQVRCIAAQRATSVCKAKVVGKGLTRRTERATMSRQ